MSLFNTYRSLRLRMAVIVALATSWISYQSAISGIEQFSQIKQKQFRHELRNITYDLISYINSPQTDPNSPDKNFIESYNKNRYDLYVGWALALDAEPEYFGNTIPQGVLNHLASNTRSDLHFKTRATAKPRLAKIEYPISGDIHINYIEDTTDPSKYNLAVHAFDNGSLFVWHSLENIDLRLRKKRWIVAMDVLTYSLSAGVVTWVLIHISLAPTRRITRLTTEISAKKLDIQIPHRNEPSEFGELITVLNQMLARLRDNFKRISEFSENASHELKTPLTILQAQLELDLNQAKDGSKKQLKSLELLEEVQKLIQLTDTLLLLSKSDRKELITKVVRFDLSESLLSNYELIQLLDTKLSYSEDIERGVQFEGDPELIRQMAMNLATNAIRYNIPGGFVSLALKQLRDTIVLTVTNSGKPIPPEKVNKIFDRFYRADPSRSRQTGGQGLGLNLANEIAKAHNGKLELAQNKNGRVTFQVNLPRG